MNKKGVSTNHWVRHLRLKQKQIGAPIKWNAYVSLHINVLWNVLSYKSKYTYPLVTSTLGRWEKSETVSMCIAIFKFAAIFINEAH